MFTPSSGSTTSRSASRISLSVMCGTIFERGRAWEQHIILQVHVLPAPRGNVRAGNLASVYRDDHLFKRLRNADLLMGKCGRCKFREICGGSRSRAFAATGAVMAADPLCAYEPGPDIEPTVGSTR
jgi:radical SAM protein with 4Fe4S-binding SPASM domain